MPAYSGFCASFHKGGKQSQRRIFPSKGCDLSLLYSGYGSQYLHAHAIPFCRRNCGSADTRWVLIFFWPAVFHAASVFGNKKRNGSDQEQSQVHPPLITWLH